MTGLDSRCGMYVYREQCHVDQPHGNRCPDTLLNELVCGSREIAGSVCARRLQLEKVN